MRIDDIYTPRALDLFCGAGGATYGLQRAGFHVTGVDLKPQPHYCGDVFVQADALTFPLDGYDLYWCSPPCQFGSECTPHTFKGNHPNHIPAMRARLADTGKPYIIENVEAVRGHLREPLKLCGSMFGLPIWRHRYFECYPPIFALLPCCKHDFDPVIVSGQSNRKVDGKRLVECVATMRAAMEIPWMTKTEITLAIPPAYSEFLGRQILASLESRTFSAYRAANPVAG